MQDGNALSIICDEQLCIYAHKFAHLKTLINHPRLEVEEKFLWLWLATTKANNLSFTCSITYRNISDALNVPLRFVHRALFRLMLMGFINASIPIYYGEPTPSMVTEELEIKLLLPPKPILLCKEDSARTWSLRGSGILASSNKKNKSQGLPLKKEASTKKQRRPFNIIIMFIRIKKLIHFIANNINYRKKLWRVLKS